MKTVIIGGSGLIGSKVSAKLSQLGHEVVAASPESGVNTLTGEGLDEALKNADIVIDVSNSPSFEDEAALEFFETSGYNLFAAEAKEGVKYHIALSVVGTERLQEVGYFRAKQLQENLIRKSGVPYCIVHSTQFFEFLGRIIASAQHNGEVHLSPSPIQPIAADDVASAITDVALGKPINGIVEIAGPEVFSLAELARRYLAMIQDRRKVKVDPQAGYFGAVLNDKTLLPGNDARLGEISFEIWMNTQKEVLPG